MLNQSILPLMYHLLHFFLMFKSLLQFLTTITSLVILNSFIEAQAQEVSPLQREKYLAVRQKLLESDSLQAFDAHIKLSNEEQKAADKLNKLQKEMNDVYKEENYFPPEHNFYNWRDYMYGTKLFEILKKMPKGGIHHLHPVTLQDYEWIVEQAAKEDNCYVYWAEDNASFIKGQLHFYAHGKAPIGFQKTKILANKIPNFKSKLLDLLTFDVSSSKEDFDTWLEFEKSFQRVGGFYRYAPMFKKFYIDAIQKVLEDGVFHLELRTIPRSGLYNLEQEVAEDNEERVVMLWKEIEAEIKKQNPVFSIKLIYTFLRFFDKETVYEEIEKAFQLRSKYPEMVKGFDLVAEEDAGNTTLYFLDDWLRMEQLEKKYNTDLPLFLHDGESTWPNSNNLYDALILKSKRIGHGFNLFRFPILQKMAKENDICIEVNPLSNQILDYIDDLRIHPAVYYMNNGIQISISPDDPGVFGYIGVTPDYWASFLAWGLDLRALKKLVYNSIEYSTLEKKEKKHALKYLDSEWAKWITWLNEM